ncbi:hypothetical protein [Wolbachia endosymbiont of Litomosoides sigmodontis]|uniref:hypothetical protein n=1 Tax=Wolbachia endosymbiont of Litomosoides sigmodontis TaxID=80850 RepID=UPI001FE8BBD9|nr:hypothetical protein [Wolbachia endosymbiont of Litomosoides sigmodontis]
MSFEQEIKERLLPFQCRYWDHMISVYTIIIINTSNYILLLYCLMLLAFAWCTPIFFLDLNVIHWIDKDELDDKGISIINFKYCVTTFAIANSYRIRQNCKICTIYKLRKCIFDIIKCSVMVYVGIINACITAIFAGLFSIVSSSSIKKMLLLPNLELF